MTDAVTHFQGGGHVDKWHGRRTERALNSVLGATALATCIPTDGRMAGRMDGMVSSVPDHIPSRSRSWLCCSLCV